MCLFLKCKCKYLGLNVWNCLHLTWYRHENITYCMNPSAFPCIQLQFTGDGIKTVYRDRKENGYKEWIACIKFNSVEYTAQSLGMLTSSIVASAPLRFSMNIPASAPNMRCWSRKAQCKGVGACNQKHDGAVSNSFMSCIPLVVGCSHVVEQLIFKGHPLKTFLNIICREERTVGDERRNKGSIFSSVPMRT